MRERIQTLLWPRAPRWSVSRHRGRLLVAGAFVTLVALGGSLLWMSSDSTTVNVIADAPPEIPVATTVVELSPEKRDAANIHTVTLAPHEMQDVRRVPGKIGYNTARRIEIKLPVGGVVSKLLVEQGQAVKQGDPLAILSSSEVGLARTEVVTAEAELELASKEDRWAAEVATNLRDLEQLLATEPDMPIIEKQFDNRLLGDHRDRVLSAYSKLLVAQRIWKSTQSVASTGGISGVLTEERRSTREIAAAQFKSALEQSLFQASQQQLRAHAALERADQVLAVSRQKLQLLLGSYAEIADHPQDDTLCQLILRAPINGIVEERLITPGLYTTASQVLFTLTNSDSLWVSAHIYDRQWGQMNEAPIQQVEVTAPAVPGHTIQAKVLFTGVTTSAESGAVTLVAEFSNSEGHFKPGMFAWVSVPVGEPRQALTLPASAITRHEQKDFVFVEEQPGKYRRTDVELGATRGEVVEVASGLTAGEHIVDHGVFVLKSDLLLGDSEE